MELFWTQITDAQPARPARTKAHGSAWGVSLLAYAVRAVWGIDLPETAELPGGKPYFPACGRGARPAGGGGALPRV